ncbi:MAG: hypothetical protein GQ549_04010 [Gammaproteobacteria bacterium]|nr:hypothetical protein [Gammaproteobacteria bacterium]
MRKNYTNIILLCGAALLLSLTGCISNDTKDESSPFYSVPVHSILKLNQSLIINGGQVATYVQNGKVMPERDVDKYSPNCKFEIYTMSEQPRTVDADSFLLTKVVDNIESSSLKESPQLAALDGALVIGLWDRSYMYNYATMMYLHSDRQKDVYRMTCQHWEDVMDDMYLSVTQMRQAMGKVFTLEIKK